MKTLTLLLLTSLSIISCGSNRTEYVYIKPDLPEQKVYNVTMSYDLGTLVNKGDKVCVQSWDVCIPKSALKELATYINHIKTKLDLSNSQSVEMNALLRDLENDVEWKNARDD